MGEEQRTPERARGKLGYRLLTVVALGAAAVGVALPLLPTAPFLLLAAWSASHHSPQLEARLLENPRVGPHIRAWREQRALSRRARRAALTAMAISFVIALLTLDGLLVKALLGHFGSVRAIQTASLLDLERVPGVDRTVARAVYDAFHEGN